MRSFFSWLMTLVFAFEPFLQVQAAEKMATDQMVQHIQASSLGVKGKTYGDLYMFIKMNLPSRLADRFAQMLLSNRNQPLPNIEFSKIKTKEGHDGLKMVISGQGSTHTLEILNEDAMFAKLDGVPLTIQDVDGVTPALTKIVARNPNLYSKIAPTGVFKKGGQLVFNPSAENSVVGGNFLIPSKENWENMTSTQRMRFLIELRRTWKASLEVENFIPGPKAFAKKKTASLLHPYFLNALHVDEAFAAAPAKGAKVVDECKTPVPPAGDKCIHSGYIGLITSNGGRLNCTHPNDLTADQKARNPDIAKQEVPTCSKGMSACNPKLYGFERTGAKGQPICIEVSFAQKKNQDVTHWEGQCEVKSPLDSTAEAKLKGKQGMPEWLAKIDIDPGNVPVTLKDQIRSEMARDKIALNNAAEQLASSINMTAEEIRTSHFAWDKDGSPEKTAIFNAVEVFYMDINAKLAVCKTLYSNGEKAAIDRNHKNANCDFSKQLGACQQLIRRKLVMDALMDGICPLQVKQIGPPKADDPLKRVAIKEEYDDAKLDSMQKGSLDPKKSCMTPTAALPGAVKSIAPVLTPALNPAPVKKTVCELNASSRQFNIQVDGDNCICVSKEDPKVKKPATPDLNTNDPQKFLCMDEDSGINPWIPIGIVGAAVGLYALNRHNTKPRLGECPPDTKRVGENCYFTPICDKVRYPEVTLVNNECVLPGKCAPGVTMDANGKCLGECASGTTKDPATGKCMLPSYCPPGSKTDPTDPKKCIVNCPPNTKPLANNTCQWGVACPYKNNQIVYDLSECTEGNGTTTPTTGAGGVQ